MNRTIAARIAALTLAIAVVVSMQVAQAPPAAAVTTYGCNPSATTWNVKARWGDGTVMEARACLQLDGEYRRVKTEWRVRRGGTAISGTDWDMDSYGTQVVIPTTHGDVWLGRKDDYTDRFNTSYLVTYSYWDCHAGGASDLVYYGDSWYVRATPPGLPRSGYKDQRTDTVDSPTINC